MTQLPAGPRSANRRRSTDRCGLEHQEYPGIWRRAKPDCRYELASRREWNTGKNPASSVFPSPRYNHDPDFFSPLVGLIKDFWGKLRCFLFGEVPVHRAVTGGIDLSLRLIPELSYENAVPRISREFKSPRYWRQRRTGSQQCNRRCRRRSSGPLCPFIAVISSCAALLPALSIMSAVFRQRSRVIS